MKIILENKKILTDWVEKTEALSFTVPNSGTTALIKYDHDMESEEFCRDVRIQRRLRSPRKLLRVRKPLSHRVCPKKEVLIEGLEAVTAFLHTL
jgi:hypothetical protein